MLEPWEFGDSFDEIDWLSTLAQSPHPIPGLTTARRTYGEVAGEEVRTRPVDLDLYVDSSGSMPDPRRRISFLTLAGAIIALSALRTGAKVQVTLWSGKQQMMSTGLFERRCDPWPSKGYRGANAFPHKLRNTSPTEGGRTAVCLRQIATRHFDHVRGRTREQRREGSAWRCARRAADDGAQLVGTISAWMTRGAEKGWESSAPYVRGLLDFARRSPKGHYQPA